MNVPNENHVSHGQMMRHKEMDKLTEDV